MNIINICNYKIYLTDSCYKYLELNKKKNFYYKIFILKKGFFFSKTILNYSKKISIFSKKIIIKNILFFIDTLSICFLNNTCIHYKKKIYINSPFSYKNLFNENKILNKIFYLIKYFINKKLITHNGFIKIFNFNFNKKELILIFSGNCYNCNISNYTFNNFIKKILKKITFLKKIKIYEKNNN
ncbi:putative iron-sulfur cluster scaffold protein [Candidatus Carsonella ruddii CS isolate Thao2000]|uniref:Putative iron-sulfur cluster scaffold protein n=1 Tax=Candidatus Carsonella ruddii CS isolate Thao2000 TaxID=1202537 RepID=J7GWE5_CARRU|nr:NifU family protein [Candidatus Carsonella ruddii]AFP83761.1 putative iron-sulfur cluster scaffold protein [Candidatus Carsonella ruddii CS isolate Thao2000]